MTDGQARRRRYLAFAAAAVGIAAAVLLYAVPPGQGTFYPPCLFHFVTGFYCAGCGATRCAHALLHGDVAQAFAYNPYIVLLLPYLLLAGMLAWLEAVTGRAARLPRLPANAIKVLFVLIVLFWVLRNVPVYPFTLLAPHDL